MYIGNWASDKGTTSVAKGMLKSMWNTVLQYLTKRPDGYSPLSTHDEDEEAGTRDIEGRVTRWYTEDMSTCYGKIAPNLTCKSFESSFDKILIQLREDYSFLRTGNNMQLVLRIVVNLTKDYLDVVRLYKGAIFRIHYLMQQDSYHDKEGLIARVSTAKQELAMLLRWLHPLVDHTLPKLEKHVRETNPHDEVVLHHMDSISRNLRQFKPDCTAQIEACDSLIAEYDRNAGDTVNNILNILTVITFLVMPLQILTGLYGMNFKKMPELEWAYGYQYFFALASVLTVLFAIILAWIYRVAT